MLADNFREGQRIPAGTIIATIDSTTYSQALVRAKGAVAARRLELEQTEVRAAQSRRDWVSSGRDLKDAPTLVTYEPQIAQSEAALQSALADVARAEYDLERTVVRAPFDALVDRRSVGLGRFMQVGQEIGQIIASDRLEIHVPITPRELGLLTNPETHRIAINDVSLSWRTGNTSWEWPIRFARTDSSVNAQSKHLRLFLWSTNHLRAPAMDARPYYPAPSSILPCLGQVFLHSAFRVAP